MVIRYVSPFGSPAWMSREQAERHLVEDDWLWLENQAAGNLSEYQKQVGPPRIEKGSR